MEPVTANSETAACPRSSDDRRIDRRMDIRIPIELRGLNERPDGVIRTVSNNISSRGLYVEVDRGEFRSGQRMEIAMRVPAGEGVSPAEGQATCTGEIVRIDAIRNGTGDVGRSGLAIRFLDRLRLAY